MKQFSLDRRLIENFNWPLLLAAVGLGVCGLINLYSVSLQYSGTGLSQFGRQSLFFMGSLAVLLLLMLVDYRNLKRVAWPLYGISIMLLLAVLLVGVYSKGAQRWLDLGFLRFQPSEPIKVALVVVLANYFSEREYTRGLGFLELLVPSLIILLPFILILKQPDLGTALHMAATAFPMFLVLKPRLGLIITFGAVVIAALVFIFGGYGQILVDKGVLKEYHLKRIETFTDPEKDEKGAGWNIIQSKRAVGSGQLIGRGFGGGTQHKNGFLPESETDFAFAALAEEWGFVGSLLVLGLFMCVVLAGLFVARRSEDNFGGFLALGLSSLLFWQMAINAGMVMGLLPVVGIPLPFISYGGTAMVVNLLAVGIILNVSMRRFMFQEDPVKQNPEVWRKQESGERTQASTPVRRLSEYTPEEPDLHPAHRHSRREPWRKYISRKKIL